MRRNPGMKAIIDALNVVYGGKPWLYQAQYSNIAFTLRAAIVALLLALDAVVVLPLLLAWLGFANVTASTRRSGGVARHYRSGVNLPLWPEPTQSALAMVSSSGRRSRRSLRLAPPPCRSIGNFAHYDATYGSLGGSDRHDDVDVDLLDRDPVQGPAQLGDEIKQRVIPPSSTTSRSGSAGP